MPGGPPGSLGLTLSRSAHGHVKVAAVHPTSPLYHELAPGDVVMLVDGETTLHANPAQLQAALPRAPDVEHVLLVCVEEFFDVGGDATTEEAGGEVKAGDETAPGRVVGPERDFSPPPRDASADDIAALRAAAAFEDSFDRAIDEHLENLWPESAESGPGGAPSCAEDAAGDDDGEDDGEDDFFSSPAAPSSGASGGGARSRWQRRRVCSLRSACYFSQPQRSLAFRRRAASARPLPTALATTRPGSPGGAYVPESSLDFAAGAQRARHRRLLAVSAPPVVDVAASTTTRTIVAPPGKLGVHFATARATRAAASSR